MTAIVAHAEPGFAFIAGDTKRLGGLLPIRKLHVWSDHVVFGQAGNGLFTSQAIAAAFACQGLHGDDLAGLVAAFDAARKAVYPKAVAATAPKNASPDGTILIACSDPGAGGPSLTTMSLDPQFEPVTHAEPAYGIGVSGIEVTAANLWKTGSTPGTGAWPGWATSCLQAHPDSSVDWPMDIVLAGPSATGGRTVTQQRLASAGSAPDPCF